MSPATSSSASRSSPLFNPPVEQLRHAFEIQAARALALRASSAEQRLARIKVLRDALLAQRSALYAAFAQDMHKSVAEVEATELMPVLDEMRHAITKLKSWMKPQRVWPTMTTIGLKAHIHYQAKGRTLIIAPWNYPLNLCLGPLVSAIAAGNTVILKPSEMTPAVSQCLRQLIASVFDPAEVALFEGDQKTAQALLELPFDHIFFTGSPAVGKLVMAAAAKHLSSVTLELGGKSPAIVDENADVAMAAENLMWGKFINSGQTCIAPDYVYVHSAVKADFIRECKAALDKLYGQEGGRASNPDLTHIVNARHTQRVKGILDDALARGARVLVGGQVDEGAHFVAPTLLEDVSAEARAMQEEIFGPLLPIVPFSDVATVIAQINAAPKPLALYVYSKNAATIERILQQTSSGGACINHCMIHYAHGNLPFGGVNNSGIGSTHGHFGFKAFSHERSVLAGGLIRSEKWFAPPFTPKRLAFIQRMVNMLR